MFKQGCFIFIFIMMLSGCWSGVWTGANLIYDRHSVYKKMSDYRLAADASRSLFKDRLFKREDCSIDLAIFNGDILIAGRVPTEALRKEAEKRIMTVYGFRRVFNQIAVSSKPIDTLMDDWITTKIRSNILADSDIDPKVFKIVTVDQIVYLMGDVETAQSAKVIHMARTCAGVKRVVKLLKYYHLTDQAV